MEELKGALVQFAGIVEELEGEGGKRSDGGIGRKARLPKE
jgi:hypothetical protein